MNELRIALLGLGAVGRGYLTVLATHAYDFRRSGVEPVLVAAGDSRGVWSEGRGLDPLDVLERKSAGNMHPNGRLTSWLMLCPRLRFCR